MNSIGAIVAVIKEGQILLTKREDFEVWCLPGGSAEDGEPLATTAVREVFEETGLHVCLDKLVGIYSIVQPGRGLYAAAFTAYPTGGDLTPDPGEVIDLNFFDFAYLPEPIFLNDRWAIMDAINGVGGSAVVTSHMEWPFLLSEDREEIYKKRDESGLSRQAFYLQYFDPKTMITKKEIG